MRPSRDVPFASGSPVAVGKDSSSCKIGIFRSLGKKKSDVQRVQLTVKHTVPPAPTRRSWRESPLAFKLVWCSGC